MCEKSLVSCSDGLHIWDGLHLVWKYRLLPSGAVDSCQTVHVIRRLLLAGLIFLAAASHDFVARCMFILVPIVVFGIGNVVGTATMLWCANALVTRQGRLNACSETPPSAAKSESASSLAPASAVATEAASVGSSAKRSACQRRAPIAVAASLSLLCGVIILAVTGVVLHVTSAAAVEFTVGESVMQGLSAPVTIAREDGGAGTIRISAETEQDMAFAQGVVQAQTRLFQMDFNRRLVNGSTAALLGTPGIVFDKLFRTLRFPEALGRLAVSQGPREAALCEAFVAGVNAHLASSPPLPYEYAVFGASSVQPFTRRDALSLAMLVALQLSGNARQELERLALVELDGLTRARVDALLPAYDAESYPTVLTPASQQLGTFNDLTGNLRHNESDFAAEIAAATQRAAAIAAGTAAERRTAATAPPPLPASAIAGAEAGWAAAAANLAGNLARRAAALALAAVGVDAASVVQTSLRSAVLPREQTLASNNFVVHGSRTASGGSILENDPHLGMSTPGVWQALALSANDTGYSAIGASFPGVPGIILGRSRHLAWGVTTSLNDAQDIFVLTEAPIGSSGVDGYEYNGQTLAYDTHTQTIEVAGGEDVTLTTRGSIYGPVINENEGLAYFGGDERLYRSKGYTKALALSWSLLRPGAREGVLPALLAMGTPSATPDWRAVQTYLSNYTSPCQSFVFAFHGSPGDVGFTAPCLVPKRQPGHDGLYPAPGNGSSDWQGYESFVDMPRTLNPPEGFVVTANNRLTPPGAGVWSGAWQGADWGGDGWRAERVTAMLRRALTTGDGKVSQAEALEVQADVSSTFAARARVAVGRLADSELTAGGAKVAALVRDWDGAASIGSQGATALFSTVRELTVLLRAALPGTRDAFYNPWFLLSGVLGQASNSSALGAAAAFGDDSACAAVAGYSSCRALVAGAVNNAYTTLAGMMGGSIDDGVPSWGALHGAGGQQMHRCVFGHQQFGGTLLRCASDQLADGSGSIHTVAKGQFRYDDDPTMPFVAGPSYRAVVDWGLPNEQQSFAIGPGQSANLGSRHRGSAISKLVSFEYYPMATGETAIRIDGSSQEPSLWTIKP